MLSGFLIGKGFASGRYGLSRSEIGRFWIRRCLRVMPLYYAVYVVVLVFVLPGSLQLHYWPALLRMATFTYNGAQATNPNGATWFVSALMQLYLLAPLMFFCLRPLMRNKRWATTAIVVALLIGTYIRYAPVLIEGERSTPMAVWSRWIYTPIWANLDLFAVGMLASSLAANRAAAGKRIRGAAVAVMVVAWFSVWCTSRASVCRG